MAPMGLVTFFFFMSPSLFSSYQIFPSSFFFFQFFISDGLAGVEGIPRGERGRHRNRRRCVHICLVGSWRVAKGARTRCGWREKERKKKKERSGGKMKSAL